MARKNPSLEVLPPYVNLRERCKAFEDSLPLISMLNDDAVRERHWQRILEETGKEGTMEINLKTMSLTKVFDLNLAAYEEVVTEICKEAMEEAKIETFLREIEETWKKEAFELYPYEKNGIVISYTLGTKPLEETQVKLEENLLLLQTLAANKHVRSAAKRVSQWDRDLNRIAETIAAWLQVQRQWAYLEKIFSFDDIKMQLPDEAKKFGRTDTNYKKLMEGCSRQPQIHTQCVKADGGARLDELENILKELNKCQRSLQHYLDSKQMSFPRFYFISTDDLLQILGSSEATSVQRFMLSLFDNCKRLNFVNNNKIIKGMTSDEGESYEFVFPVKPEGKIEEWMNVIDVEMKNSLTTICKGAVWEYARMDRVEWIKRQIGMIGLVGT